jgi:hypothetical protein
MLRESLINEFEYQKNEDEKNEKIEENGKNEKRKKNENEESKKKNENDHDINHENENEKEDKLLRIKQSRLMKSL